MQAKLISHRTYIAHKDINDLIESVWNPNCTVWVRITEGARKGSIGRAIPRAKSIDGIGWGLPPNSSHRYHYGYSGNYDFSALYVDIHFGNGKVLKDKYLRQGNFELLEKYKGQGEFIFKRKSKDDPPPPIPDKFDRFGKKINLGDSVMYSDNGSVMFGKVTKITPAGTVLVSPTKVTESDDAYALMKSRRSNDSSIFIVFDSELLNRVMLAKLSI